MSYIYMGGLNVTIVQCTTLKTWRRCRSLLLHNLFFSFCWLRRTPVKTKYMNLTWRSVTACIRTVKSLEVLTSNNQVSIPAEIVPNPIQKQHNHLQMSRKKQFQANIFFKTETLFQCAQKGFPLWTPWIKLCLRSEEHTSELQSR